MATLKLDLAPLKRSLRLLDTGDAQIDADTDLLLQDDLTAAELYVQGAIGDDGANDDKFYNLETIKPLYSLAVYAVAAAYYQNPAALTTGQVVPIDLVTNNIIGQLRGTFAQYGGDDDAATDTTAP